MFVPGLAEKMFPRKIVEEPILLDAVREQIGGGLATNQSRLEAERLALALAAGAAERRICFSYPRLDLDQARPRVPSFYALEAVRAAEGRLPDFAELARRAETATTARLGWPAPPDPAEAIDDAEHDLAILDRLVALPGESAGAARYLVTANPYLARALRARYQRWGRSWTSADGLTSRSDVVRAIMARHTLGARSYSPTALQNYARCPYRFFLQAIHRLAPREVPEAIDELDPLQRGSLIHDVQFELFARLREENLLPVRPSNLDRARQKLDTVIAEVAARYQGRSCPGDRPRLGGWHRRDPRRSPRMAAAGKRGRLRLRALAFRAVLRTGAPARAARKPILSRCPAPSTSTAAFSSAGRSTSSSAIRPGWCGSPITRPAKQTASAARLIDGGKSLQPLLYALAAEKLFAGEPR